MPVAVVSLIVQIALIVHVIRTGRPLWWIMLLLFLPGIGALVYVAIEILPSLAGGLRARRALRSVGAIVDPGRDLRAHRVEYERSPSVDTAARLARALTRSGKPDEAIDVCERARAGVFESDPTLLLELASAYFAKQDHARTVEMLDTLRARNPEFHSADAHLLYARALEQAGETERARDEYVAVVKYYPGAEARYRRAELEQRLGNSAEAKRMFREIVEDARLAPRHFQRAQREWIEAAKKALQ